MPGLAGNARGFAHLGSRLGGDDLQLVAVDLRGRGRSETTPPGTYGWANHARDVFAVADELGFDRFAIVGQSMGGSVAMKAAELDGSRLTAVVLVDVAGRVDPGVGAAVADSIGRLRRTYDSVERYLAEVRAAGFVEEWDDLWEAAYRADVHEVDGRIVPRASTAAIDEDRAYTATQDPYSRWAHLTMPTFLLRATRELRAGTGHVVPAADRDRFRRDVPHAEVVEVDANHLTINAHPATAAAIRAFLGPPTIVP